MDVKQFMEEMEYQLIHFSYELTSDIHQKIQSNIFYYQNQIEKYVHTRIQRFLASLQLKPALKYVYYNQLNQLVSLRMKSLFEQYNILKCV